MSAVKISNRIVGLTSLLALAALVANAQSQADAYRLAATAPTGQAVLLSGARVAVAAPAQGRVLLIDSMGRTTVLAGTAGPGFSGDGGLATGARFDNPTSLVADAAGNLYVADTGNNRVRRIDPQGVVTTVAGSGEVGFEGDGGPALLASFDSLSGLAFDGQGNLYIADTGNNRIRKVDTQGIVTTVAGSGETGFDDYDVVALAGRLNAPTAIAFDPGWSRLLVADTGNNAVRSISANGTLRTLAGTGRPGFSGDGGPAIDARLAVPTGLGVDANGNVYVADTGNHRVRLITTSGRISTVDETIQTPLRLTLSKSTTSTRRITVTAPNTTEYWQVGSVHKIRWTHNLGAGVRFSVELSRDGGLTWELLSTVCTQASSSGVINWQVSGSTTRSALLRVRTTTGAVAFGLSSSLVIYQAQ